MACFVNDLKKDDIIYGFCVNTQEVEIYGFEKVTKDRIEIYGIIGDNNFYLNFPPDVNLENPILCRYNSATWWIYTVNIESLKPFINFDDWDFLADFHLRFYFYKYLNMWNQEFREFRTIH